MTLPQQLPSLDHYNPFVERDPRAFGYQPLRESLARLSRSARQLGGQLIEIPRPGLERHIDYSLYNAGEMAELHEAGVWMAWFRISMGIAGVDQEGLDQALAFTEAGGLALTYHLFLDYDGVAQADHYLDVAEPLLVEMDGKGAVALDQETLFANNNLRRPRSEAFCNRIRTQTLLKTALYTNNNYANAWGLKGTWIKPAFDLTWQAQWSSGEPTQLDGWYVYADPEQKKRCVRQSGIYNNYWWEDPVPGITSDIDIDWYYGTREDMKNLLGLDASLTLEERVTVLEEEARAHGWNV